MDLRRGGQRASLTSRPRVELDQLPLQEVGLDPDLCHPVSQGRAQLFLAEVARWVHRGHYREVPLGNDLNGLSGALLRENEGPLLLKDGVEPLEDGVVRQGDLVDEEQASRPHRLDEDAVVPLEDHVQLGLESLDLLVHPLGLWVGTRAGLELPQESVGPALEAGSAGGLGLLLGTLGIIGQGAEGRFNKDFELLLGLLQILPCPHAADEVRRLCVLVTVDAEELLAVEGCEYLAERGLAAAGLSHEEHRLLVAQALMDEDGEALQLPADDEPWYPEVRCHRQEGLV